MSVVFRRLALHTKHAVRWRCESKKTYECKLLVVGGGAGGCSVAWRFTRKMKKQCIILLEPSRLHFYQPAFTLVGAGVRNLEETCKPLPKLLPHSVKWLHDRAEDFDPSQNLVYTWMGDKIYYEYMVVAVGIKNDYDKIIGLQKALDDPKSPVSTIYSPFYCSKTWRNIQNFKGGHALFTFPLTSGKCSGAALKIMFLAQDRWRKDKIIKKTNITYNTGAGCTFGVPKYAVVIKKLMENKQCDSILCTLSFLANGSYQKIIKENIRTYLSQPSASRCINEVVEALNNPAIVNKYIRFPQNIQERQMLKERIAKKAVVTNFCTNLVEITPTGAVFQGHGGERISFPYNLLHVTPPMSPPPCLLKCAALTDEAGYLEVDMHTLQHKRFPNVFGLGDCTCTPNSKTAAAVAPQSYVIERNLGKIMAGKEPSTKYNGYGACPLLTSYNKGILAEFLYGKKIWETFPCDQSKESRLVYQLNKHMFPHLYWRRLVKGKWNGPATIRHFINPFGK